MNNLETKLPEYYLSEEERQFFLTYGYVGPFKLMESDEMRALWKEIRVDLLNKTNAPFPSSQINYDRHLDVKILSDLVNHPKLVQRINSILGPNLLCWRSAWFPKYPGDEGTDWHQAESFVEFEGRPKLVPTEEHHSPWEVTAWIAMSEATKENGCMKVMPSTHNTWFYDEHRQINYEPDKINKKISGGKKTGVYGYDYDKLKLDPNWYPDEKEAKLLELQPGEFFIFTSRCLHGSEPNTSKDSIRFGWSTRFVPTDVKVYPERKEFHHFGEALSLDRYTTMLVSGQDNYHHNKISYPL